MTGVGAKKNFPSQQQAKQPYKVTLGAEAERPAKVGLELQFMGHYAEKNIKFDVDLAELAGAGGSITYEMIFDSPSGNWEVVVMQDAERSVIGVVEFTQSNPPQASSPKAGAAAGGR